MEKTNNIVASSIDSKWSDLGSWSAVKDTFTTTKQENYTKEIYILKIQVTVCYTILKVYSIRC